MVYRKTRFKLSIRTLGNYQHDVTYDAARQQNHDTITFQDFAERCEMQVDTKSSILFALR